MTSRTQAITVALALLALPAAAQIPLGSEFRVDTRGDAFVRPWLQSSRTVAVQPDGGFLVAWATTNGLPYPALDMDVVARRFDAAGVGQGPEFVVNTYTEGEQFDVAVGADGSGNFVVVWPRLVPSPNQGIFGQRFDASGSRRGGEFLVGLAVFGGTIAPSVAMAPGGEFLVVWQEFAGGGSVSNIIGQRFDAAGDPAGAAFRVNDATNNQAQLPVVDSDGAGTFVVVWQARLAGYTALGRRFTAGGVPQGVEFRLSTNTTDSQTPSVACAEDGSFVAVWVGAAAIGGPRSIRARQFDASGAPRGPDFPVNDPLLGGERPGVDVDRDGDFVVTWGSDAAGDFDVFGARFLSSGVPAGPEFRANTYTAGTQTVPGLASDPAGNFVIAWTSRQNGVDGVFAQRYAGGLSAAALVVDGQAGPSSDGNGVFEPGETVAVAPAWLNANFGTETFTGTVSSFTGPGAPGNPAYTIADGSADYGTAASGVTASCAATGNCYLLGTNVPSPRPATHWDAAFLEEIAPANLGASTNWTLHLGDTFGDVPRASVFYRFVETLLHHGVTGGCAPSSYCPSFSGSREQMAVFVLVAKDGAGNVPVACGATPMFADVPPSSPYCRWIEELARRGVVSGCGGGNYCPGDPVSREQMAVFVLVTKEPGVTPPACGVPMFNDVPPSSPFCRWIEELARRGVVTGCGGGNYCPTAAVTREQMAVFIAAGFGLQLYGP